MAPELEAAAGRTTKEGVLYIGMDLGCYKTSVAATNGKFLLIKVMMARSYAVTTQDRPLFEATLKAVLAAPSDLYPEQRLANEIAKRRAKRYLDHAEEYF